MQKNLAIRWHSRAGQGAITASHALAQILGKSGKKVQSFPDFGAEKRGAPVMVFNRISSQNLDDASQPSEVDASVLLDSNLLASGEVEESKLLGGLKKNGILLVNTPQKSLTLAKKVKNLYAIDASGIALSEFGKDIPNVVILGSLVKILGLGNVEEFAKELKQVLGKLPPKIVDGNLLAFRRGFEEVKKFKSGSKNVVKASREKLPTWKEMGEGGIIRESGNSKKYNNGNWVRFTCKWNKKTCINCNLCWPVCPHDAIKVDKKGNMIGVDEAKCVACGLCVVACPTTPKSLKLNSKQTKEI